MRPRTKFPDGDGHADIGTSCTRRCPGGSPSLFPIKAGFVPREAQTSQQHSQAAIGHPSHTHPHSPHAVPPAWFNAELRPFCKCSGFDVISSPRKGCKHSLKMCVYLEHKPRLLLETQTPQPHGLVPVSALPHAVVCHRAVLRCVAELVTQKSAGCAW